MKKVVINLLMPFVPLVAGAMNPDEFRLAVDEMRAMPVAQADSVAASMMTSQETLCEVTDLARDILFNPDSPEYDEAVYGSFARAEAASPFATPTQKALADWEVYALGMNAPGTAAADFSVRTADGRTSTMLAEAGGEPVMLYFYNPDCHHCEQTMKLLQDKPMPTRVLAVCVDSTEKRWSDTRGALPDGWTPLFDLSDVQGEDLYIFIATPSIYLLDESGTVTSKNPPVSSLIPTEK